MMTEGFGAIQPDDVVPAEKKVPVGSYGMPTEEGNRLVGEIVQLCRKKTDRFGTGNESAKLAVVYLKGLARKDGFKEAGSDTVKGYVFLALRKK